MTDRAGPGDHAGPGEPDRAERPARRRRRVDAPPTNPEADRTDPRESDLPATRRSADPRDDWIAEQRPPHWD